jgi:DNA-directed RNA polymerase specialized sigma24 family protein
VASLEGEQHREQFRSTRWSVVVRARGEAGELSREALGQLFETYAYPLYAYARRRGLAVQDAEDAVHELFAKALEKGSLAGADPARGRFRAYLLGAFEHAQQNRRRFWNALKRGGGRSTVSLDAHLAEQRYGAEPAGGDDPRVLYEAAWARALLERAFERVRRDYEARGEGAVFARLRAHLVEETPPEGLQMLARELGKSLESIKVGLHRLRKRFRAALEEEVADTLEDSGAVDDELRHLFDALGR